MNKVPPLSSWSLYILWGQTGKQAPLIPISILQFEMGPHRTPDTSRVFTQKMELVRERKWVVQEVVVKSG